MENPSWRKWQAVRLKLINTFSLCNTLILSLARVITLKIISVYQLCVWSLSTLAPPAGLEGDADLQFLLIGGELVKIRSSSWKKSRFFKLQEDCRTFWHESHKTFKRNQTCECRLPLGCMCLHNFFYLNIQKMWRSFIKHPFLWILQVILLGPVHPTVIMNNTSFYYYSVNSEFFLHLSTIACCFTHKTHPSNPTCAPKYLRSSSQMEMTDTAAKDRLETTSVSPDYIFVHVCV